MFQSFGLKDEIPTVILHCMHCLYHLPFSCVTMYFLIVLFIFSGVFYFLTNKCDALIQAYNKREERSTEMVFVRYYKTNNAPFTLPAYFH